MSEQEIPTHSEQGGASQDAAGQSAAEAPIFGVPHEDRGQYPVGAWVVAALIVIVAVGAILYVGHRKTTPASNTLEPADAYAASLPLSQLAMSESENLSGGKLTYLDGHVKNTGDRTVTGVTVQVVFQNDLALAPQIDTVQLALISMKEPYIDVEPVSVAPLKPGDDHEFRLTFESVPDNWNTQMPEVRIIHVDYK